MGQDADKNNEVTMLKWLLPAQSPPPPPLSAWRGLRLGGRAHLHDIVAIRVQTLVCSCHTGHQHAHVNSTHPVGTIPTVYICTCPYLLEWIKNYIMCSAESHSACILSLGSALGFWPQAFLGCRMQPRTSICRVRYLLHERVRLQEDEDGEYTCKPGAMQEVVRIHPEGAPVFSLAQDDWARGEVQHQIFCGKQSRDVVAWDPPADALHDAVCAPLHPIVITGSMLLSCARDACPGRYCQVDPRCS